MRKALGVISALALVEARRVSQTSPFVGENKDAHSVDHGDGNTSMRLRSTNATYNKYESMIVREGLFKGRKSTYSAMKDFVFGKEETPLEKALRNKHQAKYGASDRRLGQTIVNEMINTDGTMWVGPIYMGGNTKMDVVYDTGSDWLVMEDISCGNCEGNKYDIADSQGTPTKISTSTSERNYGSASLVGNEYTDKVCINLATCLDVFEFFLITSQTGIREPIDGILGLSRNNPFHIAKANGNTSGPLMIEQLAAEGKIGENKFSFYFQEPAEDSWVDVGTPKLEHIKTGATQVETQLIEEDFFWGFYNTGIAIGNIDNAYNYEDTTDYPIFQENKSLYSIIDTGSTALVISSLYYEDLIIQLFAYAGIDDWAYESGVVVTKCEYDLPSLYFQIDGAWIEARGNDYKYNYNGDGTSCILFVMPMNSPMNILGMPVHVDYYTIHDPVTGLVTWAPHSNSPKGDIVKGAVPTGKTLRFGSTD